MFEAVCQSPLLSSLCVYKGGDFIACFGVNDGDAIGLADDLVLDDVYRLCSDADTVELELSETTTNELRLAASTNSGVRGNRLCFDSLLTLMNPNGKTIELAVIVESDAHGKKIEIYLLPLQEIDPAHDFRLISFDRNLDRSKLDDTIRRPLARGTRITCASGEQRAVEDLRPGDMVLTRDSGPQPVSWISQQTQRTSGEGAPIRIDAGVIGNAGPLCVSRDQRILFSPREDQLGGSMAERYVKAGALENGTTVVQKEGGFLDFFQLHFDQAYVVFAEGVAVEAPETTVPATYDALLAVAAGKGVSSAPVQAAVSA